MSERSIKRRKTYVDHPKDKTKPICLIHSPGNSSDKCKVLGDFGSKYAKSSPTKDLMYDTKNRKKFNRQQEKSTIVKHAADKILPQKNNKVSDKEEAHGKY